ncbi:hypothetical protein ElyMa_005688500 [Elysia marginata]|uniref:RNase H type-1 domain-containing protein n=1 Tax=Elysia marginata TaxID=1093978 RepID=A0AAV4FFS6_9GAST|nr:hypothetical protein ElyMa_005688500 [Elysia marginata]
MKITLIFGITTLIMRIKWQPVTEAPLTPEPMKYQALGASSIHQSWCLSDETEGHLIPLPSVSPQLALSIEQSFTVRNPIASLHGKMSRVCARRVTLELYAHIGIDLVIPTELTFQWTPGHSNIECNEQADNLAKPSSKLEQEETTLTDQEANTMVKMATGEM